MGSILLVGSEKQIAWAEKIRAQKMSIIVRAKAGELDQLDMATYWGEAMHIEDPRVDQAIDILNIQDSASWWIDNRDEKISSVLAKLFSRHQTQQDAHSDDLEREASAEATHRPETAKTETVAEIRMIDDAVAVYFPERVEEFRLILRKHGYTWTGTHWLRRINKRNGLTKDRAAEIGHLLLGSGFIVRIYDESIRKAAIEGDYQEEQTRWVSLYTSGENKGRLCISWGRDDDYYRAAKSLPTSRYVKPNISVVVEQHAEVLDFAEINGFSITDAARDAIEEAIAVKERTLVAHITLHERENRKPSDRPEKLTIPEHTDIDDALLDD